MPSTSVIVIGGGLAGLSSAVALAEAVFRVRLLEKRPYLGGRATTYTLPDGAHVDNCQHVTLGCYTHSDEFYRRACAAHSRGIAMLDWLRRHGQTEQAIERFWSVVLVSALDEELARTDAHYGVDVFWKAFLANRGGFRMGIPSVPLGELYDGCRAGVERRGGEVLLRAGVREIRIQGERIGGIALENGAELTADFYITAVPHDVLPGLLPPAVVEREPSFAGLRNLRATPITGVHLWFDRPVMNEPYLTLLDRTTQWVFNKSRLYGTGVEKDGGQYLQLVISASYDLVPRSRQEI